MGLRLREGVNLADLSQRSGVAVAEAYAPAIAAGQARGWLRLDGERLSATEAGWWVLNRVITEFLELDAAREEL